MPKCRKMKKRSPRPIFHIYCEGEKTEPYYIESYVKNHCPGFKLIQLRRIGFSETVRIAKTNRTDPRSLINLAIVEKKQVPRDIGDEFWCVYDREAENVVAEKIHSEAFSLAKDNGIAIALSNVCFEVWLLLHKQDGCAAYGSYDDLAKRSALRKFYAEYDKGDRRIYTDAEIARARTNAAKLEARQLRQEGCIPCYRMNPYTGMHKLLDALDKFFARNDVCGVVRR